MNLEDNFQGVLRFLTRLTPSVVICDLTESRCDWSQLIYKLRSYPSFYYINLIAVAKSAYEGDASSLTKFNYLAEELDDFALLEPFMAGYGTRYGQ